MRTISFVKVNIRKAMEGLNKQLDEHSKSNLGTMFSHKTLIREYFKGEYLKNYVKNVFTSDNRDRVKIGGYRRIDLLHKN
jgi:hypothetical protein